MAKGQGQDIGGGIIAVYVQGAHAIPRVQSYVKGQLKRRYNRLIDQKVREALKKEFK